MLATFSNLDWRLIVPAIARDVNNWKGVKDNHPGGIFDRESRNEGAVLAWFKHNPLNTLFVPIVYRHIQDLYFGLNTRFCYGELY
jgi:hypothetical protein